MAQQKKSSKCSDDGLKKLFDEFDKDKSGCLNKAELKELLLKGNRNITQSQLDEVFVFFDDKSGDQKITYEEFKKGLQKCQDQVQKMKEHFQKFDCDKSGCLDRKELKNCLDACGHKFTDAEIEKIFKVADPNGDNKISLDEFMNAVC